MQRSDQLRQRRRDAAPPDTRTARPAAPLQIPEDATDDPEFAEGDEDVVLEADARTVSAPTAEPDAIVSVPHPADDEIIEEGSAEATAPAKKTAPKKRAARPRAKKKTDD